MLKLGHDALPQTRVDPRLCITGFIYSNLLDTRLQLLLAKRNPIANRTDHDFFTDESGRESVQATKMCLNVSMTDITNPWQFARPELARAYLEALTSGSPAARGLFARRRMGKTEFLNVDLLPAACQAGYLGAYTNLLDSPQQPDRELNLAGRQTKGHGPILGEPQAAHQKAQGQR